MNKAYQICLFLSVICSSAWGWQPDESYSVRGVVKDATSGETLPFASVFFAGTTYGTVSDENGDFVLAASKPGTYDLVVSFSGFTTFYQQVNLNKSQELNFEVNLTPDVRDLGNVVVTAKNDESWQRDLRKFKKVFLGTSKFAKSCRILNEEVMNFYMDDETRVFEAYASEPLIIVNKALGYEIKYVLEDFRIAHRQNISTYYGFPSFKDLGEGDQKPKKKWAKNRDEAFMGSASHFFRALYAGTVEEEGFIVNQAKEVKRLGTAIEPQPVSVSEFVTPGPDGVTKALQFENYLYVYYENEKVAGEYRVYQGIQHSPNREKRQLSWIYIPEDIEAVEFEASGYLINPLAIISGGYWGFEKLGDFLPIDYEPTVN